MEMLLPRVPHQKTETKISNFGVPINAPLDQKETQRIQSANPQMQSQLWAFQSKKG